jgi:TP901 family phage tail tape measure protein
VEQVFRIEIPVEAVDKTDTAALQRLETVLQKIFTSMQRNKTEANDVFDAIERGASEAKAAMKLVENAADNTADGYEEAADAATTAGNKQEQAASSAASSAEKLETTVSEVSDAFEETGTAATDAGRKSGSAFTSATSSTDKFTQRVEKSNRTLRNMFKENFKLTLAAIDRASPTLKNISSTVKGLVGKAWRITVRMADFVTAPFRKLYNLISSPITMALSVVGVGVGASEIVSIFNDFETGMSGVRALTGATDEEFYLLKETAKELGASTSFSASQAALGMQNLGSAGFTTSEIIAAMPGMLDLAASSGEDLAVASDIAATTLRGFGLEASEAAHVADVLAEVAARTNANVADTGEAMKYIAPIANTMGLSIEEVAAAIGLLSDAGIKGSQAGTTLRGALSRLAKPTEDMQEVMKNLGLSFYDSNGQMKSISAIVGMLKTNMASLTDKQRQNALVTLFGQEALSGMMVLMEGGSEKLDALRESLESCEGAASEMAKVRLDNLAGDMEELGGAVETAKLELMEKLNPYMRSSVQWLTDKIPAVQSLLESAIDSGIEKASTLKEHLTSVFGSEEFQNADGFAEKLFIAWDKVMAEPFDSWWNGGGKEGILKTISGFGESAGKLFNGIIKGIFAALNGEEIAFDGMDLTGLAKAGAEAAKTFTSSFLSGLSAGNLLKNAPKLMQAGLFGFGAIKIGGVISSVAKTLSALKSALIGTGNAATAAAPAFMAIGQSASATAGGIAKTSMLLGGLKKILSIIPGWGLGAAVAITAATLSIKLYNDAQERQRQELLHASDAGAKAAEQYRESAQQYIEYSEALNSYKTHKIELEAAFKPLSEEDKRTIRDTISELEKERIELETTLADGGLSDAERAKLSSQLLEIEANRVALSFTFKEPTPEEKEAIIQQIEALEEHKIDIQATINGGGLSEEDVAALEKQVSDIEISKICLKATIEPITEEEILLLTSELAEINDKKIQIQALIDGGGLPEEQVSALEQQIDSLNNKEVLIKATLGTLSDAEIAQYAAQQLGIDYDKLIELSGGVITQADVAAGRATDEDTEYVAQQLQTQMETDLYNLQAEVQRGREMLPEMMAQRAKYKREAEHWTSEANDTYDDKKFLGELETRRANALAKYNAGEIDQEALINEGVSIVDTYKSRFGEGGPLNAVALGASPELLFGSYGGGLLGSGIFGHFIADRDASSNDTITGAIEYLEKDNLFNDERRTGSESDYNQQNAALVQQYQNEKALMEGWSFIDTSLAGQSIENVAASYATLDTAGQQAFANAVAGLAQLNEATGYITESEKVGVQTVIEQAQQSVVIAANTEVIGDVQSKLTEIATSYQGLEGDAAEAFNAEHIDAVNTALESLGLDKIESLGQINGALAQIAAVDPSGLDFSAATASVEALGGSASSAMEKVSATKAQLDALAGTYEVKINITQSGSTSVSLPSGAAKKNAAGGIYDGAMLSWVAEDGPEAIIPLSSKRRERGLQLWLQAGEMLGITEFADGGIVAPYSGTLSKLTDDGVDDDVNFESSPIKAVGSNVGESRSISVSVTANPVYQIESSDTDGIIDKIKAHQKEIAEILGDQLADELEDIISNMA